MHDVGELFVSCTGERGGRRGVRGREQVMFEVKYAVG